MNSNRVYDKDGNILKSGAIILKDEKILLIYRDKRDDWTFPKGHLDEGETIEECMFREVKEETGLEVKILQKLQDIIYEYPEGDGRVRLNMFLVEPESGFLRAEYKGDKLCWMDYKNALKHLSYDNNIDFIKNLRSIFG